MEVTLWFAVVNILIWDGLASFIYEFNIRILMKYFILTEKLLVYLYLLFRTNTVRFFFPISSIHSSGDQTPPEVEIPPEAQPPAPSATLVENLDLSEQPEPETAEVDAEGSGNVKVKFETLRSVDQSGDTVDIDSHMSERVSIFYH